MLCPFCRKDNPTGATVCQSCHSQLSEPSGSIRQTEPVSGTYVPDARFEPGRLIAGRYLVERELGRGGMGMVYLVRDQQLRGKEVALKLISAELTASSQGRDRFIQEVLTAQELQHPNIIRVFHLDEVVGQSFFTMEYVPGKSLREIIEERKCQGRTFSLTECLLVLVPILKALNHAHTQTPPVIHRDIKPDNIMVAGDLSAPQVKVLDFGLAKMLSPSKLTTTAMTMGTAYYMAPEQMQGGKGVDQRVDLFSLGVVFYEMLTGRVPSGRFKLPAELNHELPSAVDDIVDKVLQQDPNDRYASVKEFVQALGALVRDAGKEGKRKGLAVVETELRKQREAEEAVKRQIEAEAPRVAQEEVFRKAEEIAERKVAEAKARAEELAKEQAEVDARMKIEAEVRRQAEEEAKRKAEQDSLRHLASVKAANGVALRPSFQVDRISDEDLTTKAEATSSAPKRQATGSVRSFDPRLIMDGGFVGKNFGKAETHIRNAGAGMIPEIKSIVSSQSTPRRDYKKYSARQIGREWLLIVYNTSDMKEIAARFPVGDYAMFLEKDKEIQMATRKIVFSEDLNVKFRPRGRTFKDIGLSGDIMSVNKISGQEYCFCPDLQDDGLKIMVR